MAFQTVFKRYELKYFISPRQKERLLRCMEEYMEPDKYGRTTIRNIYFDTENFRLIRQSIEKPVYKEKLRLRSYCTVGENDTVFAELKKKYRGVVYKRRLSLTEKTAMDWIMKQRASPEDTQISREIDYFLDFYGALRPRVFLSYEREAFFHREDPGFRITFDESIMYRSDGLSLCLEPGGKELLDKERVLMEIKTSGAIPLWLCRVLTEERIYKTSFSKYGTAYRDMQDKSKKAVILDYGKHLQGNL